MSQETQQAPPTAAPVAGNLPTKENSIGVATGVSKVATPASSSAPAPQVPQAISTLEASDNTPMPTNWPGEAKTKIAKVKAFYDKYAGKVGCNPYIYYTKVIKPLEDKVNSFEKTFEFVDAEGQPISKESYSKQLYSAVLGLEMKEAYAMHDSQAYQQEKDRREAEIADKKAGRKQTIIT